MSYFICPYCDEELSEPDDCHSTDELYTHECPECEKTFTFTIEYSVDYSTRKAPCLNGEPHSFTKRIGCPEYFFAGKYECSHCDEEKLDRAEAIEEIESMLRTMSKDHWERPMIEKYLDGMKSKQN